MSASNYSANAVITVLNNGLTVITAHRALNTVQITAGVSVGGRFEQNHEVGISHFLEHMAFKGTETRSAMDIVQEVEILGADINAGTGKAVTTYYVVSLPEDVDSSLNILSDVIMNSVFEPEAIEGEKAIVIQEIRDTADSMDDMAMDALAATAYPDQAMGRPILGSEEDVSAITQDMLKDYVRRNYGAASIIVAAVGAVDHNEFVGAVQARFGSLASGERPEPAATTYVGGETLLLDDTYEQATLLMAFPAAGSVTKDFVCVDILSDILGSGMSAPLFQELREKRSLCYGVSCGTMPQPDQSLFLIYGSCSRATVEEFMTSAIGELVKIANGEITDVDWRRARNQAKQQLARRMDSPQGVTNRVISDMFTLGRVRDAEEIIAAYAAVTKEDVIATAREMLAQVPSIVVAGNAPEANYASLVNGAIESTLLAA